MILNHNLPSYTKVSYLKLIWLSQKGQILKGNLFWWVFMSFSLICLSLFQIFKSEKRLITKQNARAYSTLLLLLKPEFSST